VGDVDLTRLIEFHRQHGGILTITGVRPPGRFGEIVSGQSGRITEFNEKPQATAGRISGGFFVCSRRIFEYLEDREDLVLEDQPIRRLVADGQAFVYPHDGFWQPMDTYREYALLNQMYERGNAPWVHGW
jgi:glucose-1-phosphate cytidylyltransferase